MKYCSPLVYSQRSDSAEILLLWSIPPVAKRICSLWFWIMTLHNFKPSQVSAFESLKRQQLMQANHYCFLIFFPPRNLSVRCSFQTKVNFGQKMLVLWWLFWIYVFQQNLSELCWRSVSWKKNWLLNIFSSSNLKK